MLGGDNAGFPNGRRPGDDVVDIELRVAMGVLCTLNIGGCVPANAPAGSLRYTDGAYISSAFFANEFPYLRAPLRGSPNSDQRDPISMHRHGPGRSPGPFFLGTSIMRRATAGVFALILCGFALAAPFVPTDDAQVLERLPDRSSAQYRDLKRLQAAAAAAPNDVASRRCAGQRVLPDLA